MEKDKTPPAVLCIGCLLLLCVLLSACGKAQAAGTPAVTTPAADAAIADPTVSSEAVDLWENASPENSGVQIRYQDAGGTKETTLYDYQVRKDIIKKLSEIPAYPVEGWSADLVTEPLFSVYVIDKNGGPLLGVWSNGYFIMQDGKVYRCDADLSLIRSLLGDAASTDYSVCIMRYLTQKDGQWIPERLRPAKEPAASPEDISVSLKKYDHGKITVSFKNDRQTEWVYGEMFTLQVCLDGTWYAVPDLPDRHFVFVAIGYSLPAGESVSKTYDLAYGYLNPELPAGRLPAGTYRLLLDFGPDNDLTVEFQIP